MTGYWLYSDANTWHREYPACFKLADIKASEGIAGRARIVANYGDTKEYKIDKSGFNFSLRWVQL